MRSLLGLRREEQRLGAAPGGCGAATPGREEAAGPGRGRSAGAGVGPGVPGGSAMGGEPKPGSSPSQGRGNHPRLGRAGAAALRGLRWIGGLIGAGEPPWWLENESCVCFRRLWEAVPLRGGSKQRCKQPGASLYHHRKIQRVGWMLLGKGNAAEETPGGRGSATPALRRCRLSFGVRDT